VPRIVANIHRHKMLLPGQRIGVAVSGGADSVVLLHVLHRLRSEFGCELIVLHVNHHLRAAESDADESFVRGLARELGLTIAVEQASPPDSRIEQQTRDIRRAFFRRAMTEHKLHSVALGHTRSDQAETVLFRLLRGTGLAGLAGMRPVTTDHLIRPLLTCSREQVRAWAATQDIRWRDDLSNLDTSFTRNRLRLETLPALADAYNPNIESLLAQSADLAQTEEDYWNGQVEAIYPDLAKRTPFGLQFTVGALFSQHLALRRRLIRRAMLDLRGDLRGIEYEHVDSIVNLCQSEEGHDRVIVPGIDALRSFGQLLLSEPGRRAGQERDYQIDLRLGQECKLPFDTGWLSVNWLKLDNAGNICANFKEEQDQNIEICDWDGDLLTPGGTLSPLSVRNWRPGDSFQRIGHQASEKIKELFQAKKVLLWERKHWPVVESGGKILWVRQFGGAGSISASAESRKVIRLMYRQS
jgi:tRNA(Ile)-lysidine synthase